MNLRNLVEVGVALVAIFVGFRIGRGVFATFVK